MIFACTSAMPQYINPYGGGIGSVGTNNPAGGSYPIGNSVTQVSREIYPIGGGGITSVQTTYPSSGGGINSVNSAYPIGNGGINSVGNSYPIGGGIGQQTGYGRIYWEQ